MEANKNVIADIKKLEIMNYEDGKTYLEQNGYVQMIQQAALILLYRTW